MIYCVLRNNDHTEQFLVAVIVGQYRSSVKWKGKTAVYYTGIILDGLYRQIHKILWF